jgi:transcriptional regulator with XRE-family HTH domain
MVTMRPIYKTGPTLGALIAARREALGLSQRQLAARADVDSSVVSRLENNRFEQPSALLLQRLADALSTNVSELLAFVGVRPELPEPRAYFRRKLGMNAKEADVLARLVEGFDGGKRQEGQS